MSKATLARRIGVARSYMTKLENGQLQPSGAAMLRFAHVLERPVEDIFELVEKPIGRAAFHPISRRASVRAGESINPAENYKNMMKGKLV
jgi:DNA-binding XRE family transcriptional regulator